MSKADVRLGRQATEVGAAIVQTWSKLLPAPATILAVPSAVGTPLRVRVNRRIFAPGQPIFLRNESGRSTEPFSVKAVQDAGSYNQLISIAAAGGGADVTTTQAHRSQLPRGLAIPPARVPTAELGLELEAALRQILDLSAGTRIKTVFDTPDMVHIAVPRIPDDILTRSDLLDYLRRYHDTGQGRHYHDELGMAVIYGCR